MNYEEAKAKIKYYLRKQAMEPVGPGAAMQSFGEDAYGAALAAANGNPQIAAGMLGVPIGAMLSIASGGRAGRGALMGGAAGAGLATPQGQSAIQTMAGLQ